MMMIPTATLLALLPFVEPPRPAAPGPAPGSSLASTGAQDAARLMPSDSFAYLEAPGLSRLFAEGLEHPFLARLLQSPLIERGLAEMLLTPEAAVALADQFLGEPALPLLASLSARGAAVAVGAKRGQPTFSLVVQAMRGEAFLAPTVRDPRGFRTSAESAVIEAARDRLIEAPSGGDLGFLREAARTTYDTARRMSAITADEGGDDYPGHALARKLRLVSQLVRGGFGTRVFHLTHGGYDTHARQEPVHAERLRQVSTALDAFQTELIGAGAARRVVVLVFSEFGRRVQENASKGTDHGRGAPAFLLGPAVAGGLHGDAPDLDDLVDGDVPATTDFRGIYSALEAWMGVPATTALPALALVSTH